MVTWLAMVFQYNLCLKSLSNLSFHFDFRNLAGHEGTNLTDYQEQ